MGMSALTYGMVARMTLPDTALPLPPAQQNTAQHSAVQLHKLVRTLHCHGDCVPFATWHTMQHGNYCCTGV
jgi:hypothetical protein